MRRFLSLAAIAAAQCLPLVLPDQTAAGIFPNCCGSEAECSSSRARLGGRLQVFRSHHGLLAGR